jgi:metal-responsive CopG/Arc/MetJ family transcriptional regulator
MRNQKILISLPARLVEAVDAVKSERQVSRSAFVRESLIRNIYYYKKYERDRVGIEWDDPRFNCGENL